MNKQVTFSMNEIRRLEVIQKVEGKQLTGRQAAEQLRLSERQLRRLIAQYREQGAPVLVHGNRGRDANNRIPEETRAQILELAEKAYRDYNDSHFTEELGEKHGIETSHSTVRRISTYGAMRSINKKKKIQSAAFGFPEYEMKWEGTCRPRISPEHLRQLWKMNQERGKPITILVAEALDC